MKGGNAADPASWNKYAYVKGDPINFRDPHGLLAAPADGYCPPEFRSCDDDGNGDDGGIDDWEGHPCSVRDLGIGFGLINTRSYGTTCFWADGPGGGGGGLTAPPPPECPLVGIAGNYINDPHSATPLHDLFSPEVAAILDSVLAQLNAKGIVPIIEDGFRTEAEQQDRRDRYPQAAKRNSWHEVGDAIDFWRHDPNLAAINSAMLAAGFKPVAGGKGHYQMPIGVLTQSRVDECTKEHPNGH